MRVCIAMAKAKKPDVDSEIEKHLVEIRDVTLLSTFFSRAGGIKSSGKRRERRAAEEVLAGEKMPLYRSRASRENPIGLVMAFLGAESKAKWKVSRKESNDS
jgi:hypothetical protein